MTEDEYLKKLQENNNHVSSLSEAFKTANKRFVEASAQLAEVKKAAFARLTEATQLIDTLHDRIEFMCEEWECQIRNAFPAGDTKKEELLKIVAPFRPKRLGRDTIVSPADKAHSKNTN